MANLRLLNETNISAAVSHVEINNVFSSSYNAYVIKASDVMVSTYSRLNLRLTDVFGKTSDENYTYALNNTATTGSTGSLTGSSSTSFVNALGYGLADSGNNSQGATVHVFNPFQSSYTYFTTEAASNGSNLYNNTGGCVHRIVNSYTGITIIPIVISGSNPTVNQGTVKIYGYRVD